MTLVVAIHVKKRDFIHFVEDQFDDFEDRKLNLEAVNYIYDMLDLYSGNPYHEAFIETVASIVERSESSESIVRDHCLDTIEEIFSEYEDDRALLYDGELIYLFSRLFVDYVDVEKGIHEIFEDPIEFITLFHNRFDITFET